MDKLTMAHDYALRLLPVYNPDATVEDLVDSAWQYADMDVNKFLTGFHLIEIGLEKSLEE